MKPRQFFENTRKTVFERVKNVLWKRMIVSRYTQYNVNKDKLMVSIMINIMKKLRVC